MLKINLKAIILITFYSFASCFNAGIDTSDVISANKALNEYFKLITVKYVYCKNIGFKYKEEVVPPGPLACSDDTFEKNEGNFVWIRDYNICIKNITFAPCPENNSNFNNWSTLILSSCQISEAYFLNDYKPLQGKVIGIPRNLTSTYSNCL